MGIDKIYFLGSFGFTVFHKPVCAAPQRKDMPGWTGTTPPGTTFRRGSKGGGKLIHRVCKGLRYNPLTYKIGKPFLIVPGQAAKLGSKLLC